MGNSITMEKLEAINFPYYYNKVINGEMKAGEVTKLLFNGNPCKYKRYKRFLEGKPTYTEAMKRRDRKTTIFQLGKIFEDMYVDNQEWRSY